MNKKYMFYYAGKISNLADALKIANKNALSGATDRALGKIKITTDLANI